MKKNTKEPLHTNPLQEKKHGSTTLLQDPCSLLLNHRSIYDRERVMVQKHHREFEAPWGLAMVGRSEDRSEPLCAVGIFCTGVYLRCLRHLYPPPGKQRRWPGVCFRMCLTDQVSKKVAISPDSQQRGFSYKQLGVIHPSSPPMGRGHSLAQPWQRVWRLKKKMLSTH